MSGAVRLGLGSPPFLVKPVFLDRLFFVICAAQFGLCLGSPPFLVKPVFLDRLFFVICAAQFGLASGRRHLFYKFITGM